MFYEYSKNFRSTARIRVRLRDNIDGGVLEIAAVKAFKRFPYFNKKISVDEEGGYVLHDNDKPIVVTKETTKPVVRGGDEANQHFFLISYEGITDGHLMLEMNAIQDRLFLNFQQVNSKRIYLDAFIEELKAEGIEVKVGEMQYKRLPKLKL